MSRLIDRIFAGCQPLSANLIYAPGELQSFYRNEVLKDKGSTLNEEEVSLLVSKLMGKNPFNEIVAKKNFDFKRLSNVPVIAGDDVGAYVASFPKGTLMEDVVSSMAPPFEKFFVEFQNIVNPYFERLHAWGALVESTDDPDKIQQFDGDNGKPRWTLELSSFLEREKGKPFGPVATHVLGLAEDGTWFHHGDGVVWWGGGLVEMTQEPPDQGAKGWGDYVAQLMFPILLTISFMHCKNVDLRPVTPPEKLSRKHEKKHGHGLVRYHVLEIEPIRRILDKYRRGTPGDLRRALHICRGHFKTFTPDAPLMGRHVGIYWWAPHVRGSKEAGTSYVVPVKREN